MKQMTIEKIICDLKEIKDIEQLQVLIYKLEQSLNEKNYIKHNSSKRLNGIKRVLNNGKTRPVLNCYTPYKNGYSAITDSYQMYLLKEVKLPFKCAFNSTFNEEEKEKYIEENKVEISNLCYPDIKGILDNIEKYNIIEKLKLDVNEVLKLEKITPKNQKLENQQKDFIEFLENEVNVNPYDISDYIYEDIINTIISKYYEIIEK